MLHLAHAGTTMKPTKTGNRFVVIGSTAPASEKTDNAQPTHLQATPQRIVVIRNSELVGRRSKSRSNARQCAQAAL
jgi:hypothetical protein